MPWALRIRGPLNIAALSQSLIAVVTRHEPLRTIIEAGVNGEPKGFLLGEPTEADIFSITNLSSLSGMPLEAEIARLLAQEASTSFNLSIDYSLRANLLFLSDDESILALTIHHHAADGMSTGVFINDLQIA